MSIKTEIDRIKKNVDDAFEAIRAKGVNVPQGTTSNGLADLIMQIGVYNYPHDYRYDYAKEGSNEDNI